MGKRVRAVSVGGKPLRNDARYSVAATDFIIEHGGGIGELGHGEGATVAPALLRDVLTECARRQGVVRRAAGGRIISEPQER